MAFGLHLPKKVDNIFGAVGRDINPFDNGASQGNPNPVMQGPAPSVIQQVPHVAAGIGSGIFGAAKSLVSPFAQGVQNDVIDPAVTELAKASGNPWTIQQAQQEQNQRLGAGRVFGNAAQLGLDVVAPGLSNVVENGAERVLPNIVAPFARKAASLTATGGLLGGPFNVSSSMAAGAPQTADSIKQEYLGGTEAGGALGLGGALVGPALDAARRVPSAGRVVVGRVNNAVDALKTADQAKGEGGFVQVGPTPKNIHPDDQNVMAQFIDKARGITRHTPQSSHNLDLMASNIADRYGITKPTNTAIDPEKALANVFDRRLEAEKAKTPLPIRIKNTITAPKGEEGFVRIGKDTTEPPVAPPKSATNPGEGDIPKVVKGISPAKNGTLQGVKRALSDKDQVILDELKNIDKNSPVPKGELTRVQKFMYNSNLQRGSNSIANEALTGSENIKKAIGGLSKNEYKGFSDYANARSELSTATKGTPTSKPVSELKQIVRDGNATHGERFKALNAHYKELATEAHKAGIISKDTLDHYNKNGDYIRLQRDMGDLLPSNGKGGGYKLGSTTFDQKRAGSSKAALDVGSVVAERTQQVVKEIAKNRTGTHLVDELTKHGLAKQLINSDDVLARRSAFNKIKELKPVQQALDKESKKVAATLNDLVSRNSSLGPKILDRITSGGRDIRNGAVRVANGVDKLPGKSKALSKGITQDHVDEAFQQYLDGNPRLVRNMFEFIKNKSESSRLQNQLDGLKAQFEQVKGDRKEAWLDARSHSDQVTKNKNTVSIFRKGVKETYEVSPEIKEAMDNINPYSMNVVMQALSVPGRIARAGITGLNPVFIARNVLKDQFDSAINSAHPLSTHNPKEFSRGILSAAADAAGISKDPLYKEFLKHYGDQTSFDLTRNQKGNAAVVSRIRGGRRVGVGQTLSHPLRSLENVAAITEKSTRFQNFVGEYKKAISQNPGDKQGAVEKAALAAWQNSVDFSRAGTWGRTINTVIPYWNPATQGVRQVARTFATHPVKSTFMGTALVGVPLAAATAWNLSNPDTKKIYDNIPEYEKDNNLLLIPPGTKQNKDGSYDIIKIPLPPGYKDLFMPVRRGMEAFAKDQPLKGAKLAQDILQGLTGPVNTQSAAQFGGSFIPQAIKPAVQQYANKDLFTGQTIVPDYINQATDASGNPIAEKKKAYTAGSGTAQEVANKLNVSPIRVEKFVKDTGGTVASNLLNAADNAQVHVTKTLQPNQVGGQSVARGFKKSFTNAQGITNNNASAGAKYFTAVKDATKGLNANELSAYNALHPASKNFLGDQIYEHEAAYDPAARLDIYNRFPKVFDADKKLNDQQAKQGQASNPLYSLPQWQVKKVLEKENLPPGSTDPELSNLSNQEWYSEYQAKKTLFFNAIQTDNQTNLQKAMKSGDTKTAASIENSIMKFNSPDNPYPSTPPDVQKSLDTYDALPKGTGARSQWIQSNPGAWSRVQNQFAAIDNWQNVARGKRGLDATQGATGAAAGYSTSSSSSNYAPSQPKAYAASDQIKHYSLGGSTGKSSVKPSFSRVTVKGRTAPSKARITVRKLRLA